MVKGCIDDRCTIAVEQAPYEQGICQIDLAVRSSAPDSGTGNAPALLAVTTGVGRCLHSAAAVSIAFCVC
jgi:hypothetical protein